MSSPSDAAPDRSPAAGEETKSRLSRKRVTVITATALSLLEACGLEPSPSRSEKTAGKGQKAAQDAAPAGKAPADDREKKQAADPVSSRSRNTSRKKTPPSGKISRTDAGNLPEEDASLAFATGNVPEVPPVVPSDGAAPVAATPPGPVVPPKTTSARRRRAASAKAVSVPDGGTAPASGAEGQVATPVAGPSVAPSAVEAVASGPGEEQSYAAAKRAPSSRVRRSSTSGGRGRKKTAEISPAPVAEAEPTVAPEAQQGPARPMDAAALAAEADRLAAEYGLSSSGGGLVVLPGDDDWDDFPAPRYDEAPSPQTAARSAVTTPVAPCSEPAPAEARSVEVSPSAPAPEPVPAAKSASRRRRAAGTKTAAVPDSGASSPREAGEQGTAPVAESALGKPSVAASVRGEEQPSSSAGRKNASRAGRPSTSVGRGRKKTAGISSAPAAEAVPTVAQEAQQAPARPIDAVELAAEADRLAAEYGLSSSGGGLVVLPGDDDWDDFPTPRDEDAPSPQTAARSAVTAPVASFPEPAPAEARSVVGSSSVPAPEPEPALKSASRRRRAAGTKAAAVPGGGACPAADAGGLGASPVPAPIGSMPVPAARFAPAAQAGTSLSDAGSGDGEAHVPARPGAAPVAAGPSGSTPPSGTGMGKREAAFRQWAADMQARFDAGLEAEEDRAARRKDTLVVLPPPTDTGGRKRRTAKKPQAAAAEAPRPRAWITRRRSTEPGHEARFEEWHGPARTGSVLEKVFISLGASPEQAKLSRLWRSWDAVLGPDLAPLARPLGHHDDRLLIGAEDAVLLQELYYMGPEIVRRVNEFLQEDFFTAVKVSLMLDHQDLDAPSPVLERSAGRPQEEVPAPSGASLGLMDPESAVARCYARFLGMELPDPRK